MNKQEGQEEVLVPERVTSLSPEAAAVVSAERFLAYADVRERVLSKILPDALKRTRPKHWVDYGDPDNPRAEDEAAVILTNRLGGGWDFVRPRPDSEQWWIERPVRGKADEVEVIIQIRYNLLGVTISATGSARTDDAFLSSGGRAIDDTAQFGDVLKKAEANAVANAFRKTIGPEITWDSLASANIKRGDVHVVEFRKGEAAAEKEGDRELAKRAKCPICGGPMQLRSSDRGTFLGCRRFPDCRGTWYNLDEAREKFPAEAPEKASEEGDEAPAGDTSSEGQTPRSGASTPSNGPSKERADLYNSIEAALRALDSAAGEKRPAMLREFLGGDPDAEGDYRKLDDEGLEAYYTWLAEKVGAKSGQAADGG